MKGLLLATVLAVAIAQSLTLPTAPAAGKQVVCYYGSWTAYEDGDKKFEPENIDPFLCTNIVYSFVGVGTDSKLLVLDPFLDLEEGNMKRFTDLKKKNPELRTTLALGGWSEGSEKYSNMVSTAANRKTFIDSLMPFLEQQGFNGLDLDWEYPTQRGGKPADRENFDKLMSELRTEFDKKGYILTAAIAAGETVIRQAYNIPNLAKYLDFIHVMTYDMHGEWESYAHHHAPLYQHPADEQHGNGVVNADYTIKLLHDLGAPYEKLILGMGAYARGFILDNANNNGIYAPASGDPGFWGYNDICVKVRDENWEVVFLKDSINAPYAFKNKNWLGYDNPQSVTVKSQYAKDLGLGGGMVWSIDTDDFQGNCGEKFPLIKAIHRVLIGNI